MKLIAKELLFDQMETLYDKPFTSETLKSDFELTGGDWSVRDGWLTGRNPKNAPGMLISREEYYGNIMLDFRARTVLPSTHDINVMFNGSWDYTKNERDIAYVTGIQGWWHGKLGFEKSPDYRINAATQIFPFEPGRTYHVQTGAVSGHLFAIIDGKLALEMIDPQPLDQMKYGKIGFEAYSSHIQFTDFSVKRIAYRNTSDVYAPEF